MWRRLFNDRKIFCFWVEAVSRCIDLIHPTKAQETTTIYRDNIIVDSWNVGDEIVLGCKKRII